MIANIYMQIATITLIATAIYLIGREQGYNKGFLDGVKRRY